MESGGIVIQLQITAVSEALVNDLRFDGRQISICEKNLIIAKQSLNKFNTIPRNFKRQLMT